MAASSSSFIPTPLTQADNLGELHPRGCPYNIFISFFSVFFIVTRGTPGYALWNPSVPWNTAESVPEPDEVGDVLEKVVDLARQINLQVDSDDVQKLLDSHNQKLTIDEFIEMQEQDIEELESLDPVHSEDRMTIGNLTEGSI
ncbi:uncharacterized protein TNCV_4000871 [Trichonephila clavipes]|nr:uncharacterized protein TNCV_4000871 [Trichonephila clavipes]